MIRFKQYTQIEELEYDVVVEKAEYQGREVKLNDPFRLPTGSKKKFGVYAKNDKGNIVKVTFGDPNMAINPSFVAYEAETKDGELLSGIVQSETPESVTFLSAQGMRREVARSNLRYFRSGGLSLMPEGLEELMTPSELRDLISFLQKHD